MAQGSFRIEGLNDVIDFLVNLGDDIYNQELMEEIANFVVFSILDRTAQGKDVEGHPFEPYSPRYRMFRSKHGHPVDKVNLFFSGSMLGSMTYNISESQLEIYFMPTYGKTPSGQVSTVSNPEKAYYLNKQRRFFAVSEDERRQVSKMIQAHLTQIIERS